MCEWVDDWVASWMCEWLVGEWMHGFGWWIDFGVQSMDIWMIWWMDWISSIWMVGDRGSMDGWLGVCDIKDVIESMLEMAFDLSGVEW